MTDPTPHARRSPVEHEHNTCPLGEDCDLTLAYMVGWHQRDDEVAALKAERDGWREACDKAAQQILNHANETGEMLGEVYAAEARNLAIARAALERAQERLREAAFDAMDEGERDGAMIARWLRDEADMLGDIDPASIVQEVEGRDG